VVDPSQGVPSHKTIKEALASVQIDHPGKEVVMRLSAGEHIVDGLVFDASLTLSRLEIIAASGGAIILSNASTLLEVRAGSPPVKLQGLELDGQVVIEGGTVEAPVEIAGCRFRSSSTRPGRRLAARATMRALLVWGGHVSILDTFFEDLLGGAIEVSGGTLAVHASVFARNEAERGSALLITGGKVVVDNSNFTDNRATDEIGGGAIHADGTNASLELANKTMITGSKGNGGSVVSDVPWTFRLPAPLAHYVSNPERDGVAQNVAGSYDYDYPIPCSATLYGNSYKVKDQASPSCEGSCPAGYYCGKKTVTPKPCQAGTFCPEESASETGCPAGTSCKW
jgi:predicted outer membrane repeat protein